MAEHICPWWMGYVLASPIRRFLEKPEELVGPFLREGMTVMDYGCGMGFFTIPMAHMVGMSGKVLAVDIQEKMLISLERRARRARLSNIQLLTPQDLPHLPDHTVEFVAALHVVHEIPDPLGLLLRDMARLMKPHAKMLVVEPKFHVNEAEFLKSIDAAQSFGFTPTTERVCATRAQVLQLAASPASPRPREALQDRVPAVGSVGMLRASFNRRAFVTAPAVRDADLSAFLLANATVLVRIGTFFSHCDTFHGSSKKSGSNGVRGVNSEIWFSVQDFSLRSK